MNGLVSIYEAIYEYRNHDGGVHSTDIIYTADDAKEAVRAAGRFWDGRQRNVPDHFGKVICVKVHPRTLGPIGDDGQLHNGRGLFGYEWKIDTAGMMLADHINAWCER